MAWRHAPAILKLKREHLMQVLCGIVIGAIVTFLAIYLYVCGPSIICMTCSGLSQADRNYYLGRSGPCDGTEGYPGGDNPALRAAISDVCPSDGQTCGDVSGKPCAGSAPDGPWLRRRSRTGAAG